MADEFEIVSLGGNPSFRDARDNLLAQKRAESPEPADDGFEIVSRPDQNSSDTWRGLSHSVEQIPQLGAGLLVGAGMVGEKVFGSGGLSTDLKEYGVKKYLEIGEELQQDSKASDSLTYSWDRAKEGDYGALVDWLQYGIGYGGGQIAQALVSGGVGKKIGEIALKEVAETAAKGMVAKEVAAITASEAGKKLTREEIAQLAVKQAAGNLGRNIGVAAQSFGMEGGEIFGGLGERTQGREATGDELFKAFTATALAGGMEFWADKLGLKLLGGKPSGGIASEMTGFGGKAARTAVGMGTQMPVEAGTEYFQTGLEEWGKGKEENILPFNQSEEAQRQAFDAAGLGAVGGGVPAVVGGVLSKPTVKPEDIDQAQTGDEARALFEAANEASKQQAGEIRLATDNLNSSLDQQRRLDEAINSVVNDPYTNDADLPLIGLNQASDDDVRQFLRDTNTNDLIPLLRADPALASRVKTVVSDRVWEMIESDLNATPSIVTEGQVAPNPTAEISAPERQITPAIINLANVISGMSDPAQQREALNRLSIPQRVAVENVIRSSNPTISAGLSTETAFRPFTPDLTVTQPRALNETRDQIAAADAANTEITQSGGVRYTQPRPISAMVGGVNSDTLSDEQLQSIAADTSANANTRRAAQEVLASRIPSPLPTGETNGPQADQAKQAQVPPLQEAAQPGTPLREIKPELLPHIARNGGLTKAKAQAIRAIGRLTGTKVRFFNDPNAAEGQYNPTRNKGEVWVNVAHGNTGLRRVFGHEVTHQLRTQHPKAWEAIERVVAARSTSETLAKMYRDYFGASEDKLALLDQAENLDQFLDQAPEAIGYQNPNKTIRAMMMDEMISDLGGNRFGETEFWDEVFADIIEKEGTEAGKTIIQKIMQAMKDLLVKLSGLMDDQNFAADDFLSKEDIKQIRTAMAQAYSKMIQAQRGKADIEQTEYAEEALEDDEGGLRKETTARESVHDHRMKVERKERMTAEEAHLSKEEEAAILKGAEDTGLPADQIRAKVVEIKKQFPTEGNGDDRWAAITFDKIDMKTFKKKVTEETPFPADSVFFKAIPYNFHTSGGESVSDADRIGKVSDELVNEIKSYYERSKKNDRTGKLVIRQRHWYRALHAKLRQSFGGFGDFLAQLLGPTSANTPVEPNWKMGVEALQKATSGEWDGMIAASMAWRDAMLDSAKALDEYEQSIPKETKSKLNKVKDLVQEKYGKGKHPDKAAYAAELLRQIDPTLAKLRQDLADSAEYTGPIPLKENGKQFGMATDGILKILHQDWADKKPGDAPKTKNYYQNIVGRTWRATIDVWAARTLRRLADKIYGDRPRIPTVAEVGVQGNVLADGENAGSEFGFGQDVFDMAADKLRKSGIEIFKDVTAADIQAMIWFGEKETWATNDWTSKLGEEGSIEQQLLMAGHPDREKIDELTVAARKGMPNKDTKKYEPRERKKKGVVVGYESQEEVDARYEKDVEKWKETTKQAHDELEKLQGAPDYWTAGFTTELDSSPTGLASDHELAGVGRELEAAALSAPGVMAVKAFHSHGVFGKTYENTIDYEMVTRNGYDPRPFVRKLITEAKKGGQRAAFLSRRIRDNERIDPLFHRPGVEIYFKKELTNAEQAQFVHLINKLGFDGMTFSVEPIRTPEILDGKTGAKTGLRLQWVPEFDGSIKEESDVGDVLSVWLDKRDSMDDLVVEISKKSEVALAQRNYYETHVYDWTSYDQDLTDLNSGSNLQQEGDAGTGASAISGAAWRGQPISKSFEIANRVFGDSASLDSQRSRIMERRDQEQGLTGFPKYSERRSNGTGSVGSGEELAGPTEESKLGGVSATGIHYSKGERRTLVSSFFGSGAKSAELDRVNQSADKRIKHRIYFYVNTGKGINQEFGVGPHAHKADLSNVYDVFNDPLDLKPGRDANELESAILDSGFDGYLDQQSGIAVLLGQRTVPVEYLGGGNLKPTVAKAGQASPSSYQKQIRAVADNKSLPGGEMTGADWKRMMPKLMPEIDVSHLNDDEKYYKSGIVKKPNVGASETAKKSEFRSIDPNSPQFNAWFRNSQIVNAFGEPVVMYHGTARNIKSFKPKQAGAIFLTYDPDFAASFSNASADWKRRNKKYDGVGENIIPVYVSAQNPFDYENPNHIKAIEQEFGKRFVVNQQVAGDVVEREISIEDIKDGSWSAIESDEIQDYIRKNHDGFWVREGGEKNLGVYQPSQVKSAISNTGEFSDDNPDIRYSQPRKQPWYYSALEDGLRTKVPAKAQTQPAPQWKLFLASPEKIGAKKDEIVWSGLLDYLDSLGKEKVSAEQLADWVANNGVKVNDVILSDQEIEFDEAEAAVERYNNRNNTNYRLRYHDKSKIFSIKNYDNGELEFISDGESLNQVLMDAGVEFEVDGATKYGQSNLVLPGGEDHKEIVLTVPTIEPWGEHDESHYGDIGGGRAVAWSRINTRIDADGRRILFVEEVQSKRWQGIKTGNSVKRQPNGLPDGFRVVKDGPKRFEVEGPDGDTWADIGNGPGRTEAEAIENALKNLKLSDEYQQVPPAPFASTKEGKPVNGVDGYIPLVLKRLVSYAIDTGHEAIAWTTGLQQKLRYPQDKGMEWADVLYGDTSGTNNGKPSMISSVARKLGASIEEFPLILDKESAWSRMSPDDRIENARDFPDQIGEMMASSGNYMSEQPGFAITDKMREQVGTKGMPLFSERRSVAEIESSFKDSINAHFKSANPQLVKMADVSPSSLQIFGWKDNALVVQPNVIDKMFYDHGITIDQMSRVPRLLHRPLMIFADNKEKSLVFVGDDTGKIAMIAVKPIAANSSTGRKDVSMVVTGYSPSKGWDEVVKRLMRGELVYRDTSKQIPQTVAGVVSAAQKKYAQSPDRLLPRELLQGRGASVLERAYTVLGQSELVKFEQENFGNAPLFSPRRNISGKPIPQSWISDPKITRWDEMVRSLQDKLIDTKRVLAQIRKTVGDIKEEFDPYLQEMLYHGRAAKRVADFAESELKPLITDMAARGIEMQEFEDYLWAKHAGERNAQIASINPSMPDGGSGLTNAEAAQILSGQAVTKNGRTIQIRPSKMAGYQALAVRVKAINAGTLKALVDAGLETQATVDQWTKTYGDYVPLNRDMESDDNYAGAFGLGTGQGFSVRGSASKRALGSERGVVDILANVAMQRERAITRAEKNRVSQAVYGLSLTAPNPDFWITINPDSKDQQKLLSELQKMGLSQTEAEYIAKEPTQQVINKSTGIVEHRVNPLLRKNDNVLAVRIDGKDRFVMFSSDPRAQAMARGLKNLDAEEMGWFYNNIGIATRWFASINTQYNPIFGLTNGIRDLGSGALNLSSTALAGKQLKVTKDAFSALRGIYMDLRDHRAGRKPTSAWALEFEEFQREGGQTGYRDMYADSAERAKAIKKEFESIGKSKWLQFSDNQPIFGWLSDYNTAIENAVRLSAYKNAKEIGMSKQQAAALAKNLTVNFNKKGNVSSQVGALYAFFNASVQGTARIGETILKDGKLSAAGQKIVYGGLLLGVMQAVMAFAAGWDDDEPPQFQREKNFLIPLPDGKYISIPMPLGFNVLPNIGRNIAEFALGGFRNPAKRLTNMASIILDSVNPLGSSSPSQMATPTVLDPVIALSENKDFTGKSIYKEDFNKMKPTAGWTRTKDTASDLSKALAYGLNYISGGGKYEIGVLSPTPDQIDYLIGQATGGVGRESLKMWQAGKTVVSGEELPAHKIPVAGRFYGDTTGQASASSKFYDNLKRIGEHSSVIKEMEEARDFNAKREYLQEHPDAKLVSMADKASREIGYLKRQKRDALEKGDAARVKQLEARITTRISMWNARLSEKQRSAD